MKKLIYQTMFDKMKKIGIITEKGQIAFTADHLKLKNDPYMDLNIDVLYAKDDHIVISMAHNFIQNGDVMADPDMEIRIYPAAGMIEALTYQLDSMGVFQRVYPDEKTVIPRLKTELNRFLNQWLSNLIDQGFKYTPGAI